MKKKGKAVNQTRKEIRKNNRKLKKVKRSEYYSKKSKNVDKKKSKEIKIEKKKDNGAVDLIKKSQEKEKMQKTKLEKQMQKQRKKQLQAANEDEEKEIKRLEKQLKLKKSKTVSKQFSSDGLDYVLELCEGNTLGEAALAEKNFSEIDIESEFQEDYAFATGKEQTPRSKNKKESIKGDADESEEADDASMNDEFDISDLSADEDNEDEDSDMSELPPDSNTDVSEDDSDLESKSSGKKRKLSESDSEKPTKKISHDSESETPENHEWEDIYGRKRTEDGNVIASSGTKYIPPALRAKSNNDSEKLSRLRKQLKGLINRLTGANLVSISQQVEDLYSSGLHSRHNLNSVLCELISESIVMAALTPTQTVIDHALLIATLHANIDLEIGANFLQHIVENFNTLMTNGDSSNEKQLENSAHIISQLYNLKVFHCGLMHDILRALMSNGLSERNLESILIILRNVGPLLRKDDPLALKDTILFLQGYITEAPEEIKQSSRIKFMLDILLAIKNNNFSKIPTFSGDDVEVTRKTLRGAIRKGNHVAQLNVHLDDLLNVAERGKWWVVGSAWTGKQNTESSTNQIKSDSGSAFSQQLLDLARAQRMNTDVRRNIFCIVMSAEDYLDAFDKLLHLGLRGQQTREIVHVVMYCCLQEQTYNPYYGVLLQKFCDYDRKFQMAVQCSLWDKFKDLKNSSNVQITNLAKMMAFLFLQGTLPISTLKVIELGELDKPLLRLLRQTLLGVLMSPDAEAYMRIWTRVGGNAGFKQGLRLFIHHFILRGAVIQSLSEPEQLTLQERADVAIKSLAASERMK